MDDGAGVHRAASARAHLLHTLAACLGVAHRWPVVAVRAARVLEQEFVTLAGLPEGAVEVARCEVERVVARSLTAPLPRAPSRVPRCFARRRFLRGRSPARPLPRAPLDRSGLPAQLEDALHHRREAGRVVAREDGETLDDEIDASRFEIGEQLGEGRLHQHELDLHRIGECLANSTSSPISSPRRFFIDSGGCVPEVPAWRVPRSMIA